MIALVVAAAIATRAPAPPPETALAQVERTLPFRPLVLPASAQLESAELVAEPDGATGCRLVYGIEGVFIHVEERQPETPVTAPSAAAGQQIFSLDGFPATYSTSQSGYERVSALTWYRQDLTVRVWAADGASPPLLVDVTLELR